MRPASFTYLLTKPALLIAAGLVLLGAAAGRAAPLAPDGLPTPDGERSCRATKPSFDAFCRCLSASLASEDEGGFVPVGLDAAFEPMGASLLEQRCVDARPVDCGRGTPRARLRQCVVGPSPPV